MPTVTYFKPNRKRIRTFKTCDAVRVCREVLSHDETTPEELLACIARSMGFTHISLSRPTTVQQQLISPAVIANLPALIESAIAALLLLAKKYGWLAALLKDLIDGLDKIRKIIERLTEDLPTQVLVDEAINPSKCNCKKVVLLQQLKGGKNENKLITL